MSNVTEAPAFFDVPETKHPRWQRADFSMIGYERRDPATLPRIAGIGHDVDHPDGPFFMFHVAGDEWIRTIHADEIDDAYLNALKPAAAFSLGKIIADNKPQSTSYERRPAGRTSSKAECLAHYAEREPNAFVQLDGFNVGDGDNVMRPDTEGDWMCVGGTTELMDGSDVRILLGTANHADAVRLTEKLLAWLKSDDTLLHHMPNDNARLAGWMADVPF